MEGNMTTAGSVPARTTPKDFFIQIGIIVTLYVTAGALLALLFAVINAALPDTLDYAYMADRYASTMRFSISTLVISFPLYLFLGWLFNRDIELAPEKHDLPVRRWLTYLTLFVAGAVVAGDLVFLVYSFLGGEITARFVWKVLAVLLVSGLIFTYYILDARKVREYSTLYRLFAIISAVVVLASVVAGFVVIGSPANQRKIRFDDRRVQDLNDIQWQVVSHWQRVGSLPANLEALNDPIASYKIPVDPETKTAYGYELVSNASSSPAFKLCADFALESRRNQDERRATSAIYYDGLRDADNWQHGAGRTCFERTIDPKRYPPVDPKMPVPVRY